MDISIIFFSTITKVILKVTPDELGTGSYLTNPFNGGVDINSLHTLSDKAF